MITSLEGITLLDEPTVVGRAVFHHDIQIGDERWQRGDVFYRPDRHGTPRPFVFCYVNAVGPTLVCYSKQRHQLKGGGTVHCGFIDMMPSRSFDPELVGPELEFQQLLADIRDLGGTERADKLAAAWEATPDTPGREELILRAQKAAEDLDAAAPDPDELKDIETDLV